MRRGDGVGCWTEECEAAKKNEKRAKWEWMTLVVVDVVLSRGRISMIFFFLKNIIHMFFSLAKFIQFKIFTYHANLIQNIYFFGLFTVQSFVLNVNIKVTWNLIRKIAENLQRVSFGWIVKNS